MANTNLKSSNIFRSEKVYSSKVSNHEVQKINKTDYIKLIGLNERQNNTKVSKIIAQFNRANPNHESQVGNIQSEEARQNKQYQVQSHQDGYRASDINDILFQEMNDPTPCLKPNKLSDVTQKNKLRFNTKCEYKEMTGLNSIKLGKNIGKLAAKFENKFMTQLNNKKSINSDIPSGEVKDLILQFSMQKIIEKQGRSL
ncbi:hypothetical protein [Wolbachia pipientis]|uniref:hypothetical protein n=1 Tax=Wolbachia pipientis TaxID=955 RepID=UPI0020B679F2|nr:hypothetical protein [Wolbachia pipientis]